MDKYMKTDERFIVKFGERLLNAIEDTYFEKRREKGVVWGYLVLLVSFVVIWRHLA